MNILIVEDNADYQELLCNFLENAGYSVVVASDGAEALALAFHTAIDLILLDLMLPDLNGFEVCRRLREKSEVPIIMLTALNSEAYQMQGYHLRIDDYITKPVSMPLLIHKIEAVLRRAVAEPPEVITFGGITLNLGAHTVCVNDVPVEFTLREFELLYELMKAPGVIVSRKEMLNKLWGYAAYQDTRMIDTHMKNIRKKLDAYDCIETIRGVGYRMRRET